MYVNVNVDVNVDPFAAKDLQVQEFYGIDLNKIKQKNIS